MDKILVNRWYTSYFGLEVRLTFDFAENPASINVKMRGTAGQAQLANIGSVSCLMTISYNFPLLSRAVA